MVQASVTANFDGSIFSDIGGEVSLSQFAYPVGLGSLAVKLVDSVTVGDLFLYSTLGQVSVFRQLPEVIGEKIEVVNGQDRIVRAGTEDISFMLALNNLCQPFVPEYDFDSAQNAWVLSQKVYGVIKRSSYRRNFYVLKYTPEFPRLITNVADLGNIVKYGTVAAFHSGKFATLDMNPYDVGDEFQYEVYRVVSTILVDPEGQWENPDGWPNNPSYAGDKKPVPEAGLGVQSERVHEMCTITERGLYRTRQYSVPICKPFQGSVDYKPKISFRQGNLEAMPFDVKRIALDIIATRLRQAFPYGDI